MALAKERSISHESFMMSSTISHANNNISPQSPYSPEEFEKQPGNNENNSIAPDDHHGQSVINFTTFLANSDHSLLSFDHKEDYYASTDSDQSYHWPNHSRFSPEFCAFQSASDNYGSNIANCGSQNGWLYSDSTLTAEQSFEESEISQQSGGFNKRPNGEIAMQSAKKQCVSGNSSNNSKKAKVQKPISTSSKDPQSIAAKNRRERISERLKVLQELVPNGSKVDLVTMLEKAISYVKFLQLQVKVLATDEFWPVQGGKAPDISQVREAIDAILSSSQKDRTSSSK